MRLADVRAGAAAVAPMLVGLVPFGLVAGASPVRGGLGAAAAIGLSTLVFAGASQLAAINVLVEGGSATVAVLAAWMINLRLLLYSASLAPFLAREPLRQRLLVAYLLTDQAYAVSILRWTGDEDTTARVPYILGAASLLWAGWQAATVAGAVLGNALPAEVPLEFAVPLFFLVLLVPTLTTRPAVVAAAVAGTTTVVAGELGAGHLALIAGALAGIAAGSIADASS